MSTQTDNTELVRAIARAYLAEARYQGTIDQGWCAGRKRWVANHADERWQEHADDCPVARGWAALNEYDEDIVGAACDELLRELDVDAAQEAA